MMLPSTSERVRANTNALVNQRIRQQTEARVAMCAAEGSHAIDERLNQLDEEWDIERWLETMAPTITLAGLCLGLTVSRRWLAVPVIVQGFFLQHALQGWCPPISILRQLGVRTIDEIHQERFALKLLRGDFRAAETPIGVSNYGKALRALQAVSH
jgi:hypothetical protein